MKPGEKVVLLIGIASIAALAIYQVVGVQPRKFKRWKECAGDVETMCAEPTGKGNLSTRVVRCMAANYPKLSTACQEVVAKKYPSHLKRARSGAKKAGAKASAKAAEAAPIDVGDFLAPCKPFWDASCKKLNDRDGSMVECIVAQPNFNKFSKKCHAVMVEIVQWAPKDCVDHSAFAACKSLFGTKRLACFLRSRGRAPSSCNQWLRAVETIVDR